jgi:hypothetical protein
MPMAMDGAVNFDLVPCGRRTPAMSLRSQLYRAARILGPCFGRPSWPEGRWLVNKVIGRRLVRRLTR